MSSQNSATEPPQPHAPLLRPRHVGSDVAAARTPILALLLGRAAGRRGPSMLVRETAARELEERRADWGYSKPVVALDMTWNMAFVVVSAVMLACTVDDKPNTPIRLWICGYALQCLVHAVLVWVEYRRRNRRDSRRRSSEEEDLDDSEDEDFRDGSSGNLSLSGWVEFCFAFIIFKFWSLNSQFNCYLC